MSNEPIAVASDLSLADLAKTAGQLEEENGALLAIDNDGIDCLFTFDEEHDPEPNELVRLQIVPFERITAPDGFYLVCEGDAFVAGQLEHLAAFRALAAGAPPPDSIPAVPSEDLLVNALRIALRINEIGDKSPYQLSFAKRGESGGSFGFTQCDLAGKQETVQETFKQILDAAGITDNGITARLSVHVIDNPLTPDERAAVDAALSSAEGRRLVDAMDEAIFAALRQELARCVSKAAPTRTIEPVAQIYMLLWINMTGEPTTLLDWLGGNAVTLQTPVPAPGPVVGATDIEDYLLASKFFTENRKNFAHLRQSVAAGEAVVRAGHPLVAAPEPPPPPGGGAPAVGPIRISPASSRIDLTATLAIRQLVKIVGEATRSLPEGFSVVVTSTLRPGSRVAGTGGISRHATGEAIDIQIKNPAGKPIPNKGDDTPDRLYERLAIAAYRANEELFPARHGQLAWGGNFTTGPANGPHDLMHFDYGGDRGRFGTLAARVAKATGVA